MTNFLRRFGNQGYGDYGRGQRIEALPGLRYHEFTNFGGGYDKRDSRQDVEQNATPYSCDMQVTDDDKIRRAPGISDVEVYATRAPKHMVLQAGLDYNAELVLFDPPFLGVKSTGATTWTDHLLPVTTHPYATANFGEELIFSDGATKAWSRVVGGGAAITALTQAPPARAYASFAARLFAADVIDGGVREPLGIRWSAASSFIDDWNGIGSGFELLIGSAAQADKIIALRPIGFDQMAVICRRSIWMATRTGLVDQPANFQLRLEGIGAINETCVSLTPGGVVFLGDAGVYVFDGTNSHLISDRINEDLLPLDFTKQYEYRTYYHPGTKFLYVFTPTDTWVFDTTRDRWYRRSAIVRSAVAFGFGPDVESYDLYVLGNNSSGGVTLGKEDVDSYTNFGNTLTPIWEFPMSQQEAINMLVTHRRTLLEYTGSGTIEVHHPDLFGDYRLARVSGLPQASQDRVVPLDYRSTGLGLGMRLKMISGFVEISKVQVGFVLRNVRQEPVTLGWLHLNPDTGEYEHVTEGSRDAEWVYDYDAEEYVLSLTTTDTSKLARIVLIGDMYQHQ